MILLVFDYEQNAELGPELAEVKAEQKRYPRRELARVDDYFEHWEPGLRARKNHDYRKKSNSASRRRTLSIGVTSANRSSGT